MARFAHARLHDIDQTISNLLEACRDRSQTDLITDWAFAQACNYALQTIGEAVNNLPAEMLDRYPEVPWRKVIALSHKVRHEYFRLDSDIIWDVITTHLEPLQQTVRRMMNDQVHA